MVEVIVFAEGQTEEKFIKQVVAPALHPLAVFVKPQLLSTSTRGRGGAVSYDRLKLNARNTLRSHAAPVLTTFLDLYGLDTDFPAYTEAQSKYDVYDRVCCLEEALHKAIVDEVECRPDRFIPHVQPYEFEGLLFSDVEALCCVEPTWSSAQWSLAQVRDQVESPEHINDGYDTKPSKRLEVALRPHYRKTRHGPLAAQKVTLERIEAECHHFHEWMDKLRGLAVESPW